MLITKVTVGCIFLLFVQVSCIDRYYVDEQVDYIPKLVFDATLTDEDSLQKIVLSIASSPDDPKFIPYSDCIVEVINADARIFPFEESTLTPGQYVGNIGQEFMAEGARFKLSISTSTGIQYISNFEEVLPSPPIDTLYFKISSLPTSDPDYFINGIQFYLDLHATNEYGRKYRYTLKESYEYHSTWPIRSYLNERNELISSPADYSKFICYKEDELSQIFLLSTDNLSENSFTKFPLNFVDDRTQRLLYNYSLSVNQFVLSDGAFNYWKTLKETNQESEGLFARQPAKIDGNIYNISKPEEKVLGYFTVSSVSKRRINIKTVKELTFSEVPYCSPLIPEVGYPPDPRPLYLVMTIWKGAVILAYGDSECFDCTLLGGTVEKPWYFE